MSRRAGAPCELPRAPTRIALHPDDPLPGPPLRRPHAPQGPLVHDRRGDGARARHRRQHHGLHLRERGAHPRPAVRATRTRSSFSPRTTRPGTSDGSPASWQEFEDWRAKARSFSGLAAFRPQQMNVSDPDHPAERVSGAAVTANTLRAAPAAAVSRPRLRAGRGRRRRGAGRHPRLQRLEEPLRQRPRRHRPHAQDQRSRPTRSSA